MFKRIVDIAEIIKEKSIFLFGARQTGKTTLLKTLFSIAKYFNLNQADTYRTLLQNPERIRQSLSADDGLIIIDEIQRLPELLHEVQVMLDEAPSRRFILTGSSARSLRAKGINLLGGRARVIHLYPLTSAETNYERLSEQLLIGGLPSIITSSNPWADLNAYVGVYLQEEIRAEGLVRSLEGFSRLLEVAAQCNAEQINFTKVASDVGMPSRTVSEHFQILEDTLIASTLPSFQYTKKRKPVATAKFYFFDIGVVNALLGRKTAAPGTEEYGKLVEHFIFTELRSYLSYTQSQLPLTYWRTLAKQGVDFVIGKNVAIEVKSKAKITVRDCKNLLLLAEEIPAIRKIVVCNETISYKMDNGIEVMNIVDFLKKLWDGNILI